MRRLRTSETEPVGQDSFLDVVTNIVGIIILLVMVVGLRVQHAVSEKDSTDDPPPANEELEKQLAAEQRRAVALESELLKMARETENLEALETTLKRERLEAATVAAMLQRELQAQFAGLDAESREKTRREMEIQQLEAEVAQLRERVEVAQAAPPDSVRVETPVTAISQQVEGSEAHFQIRAGRLAYVPLESLIDQFKQVASEQAQRFGSRDTLKHTIGPVGGFRMRYTLERKELPFGQGVLIQLQQYELLPMNDFLGESSDVALGPQSEFRQRLQALKPGQTTVTLWTYPDSFDVFRQARDELYRAGFQVAARPVPHHLYITGSPYGTRSQAQ